MEISSRAGLGLLACLMVAAPASAAGPGMGDMEASVSWHLGFGGDSLKAGYGLSLGYRSDNAPLSRLVEMDVSETLSSLRLAGLPLVARSYRADEAGDPATSSADLGARVEKPWYTRSWVLWTAGGLAATAALAGGGGGDNTSYGNSNSGNNTSANTTGVSTNDNGSSIGCVNGQCAACVDGTDVTTGCHTLVARPADLIGIGDVARDDPITAGTGGMGDLAPR